MNSFSFHFKTMPNAQPLHCNCRLEYFIYINYIYIYEILNDTKHWEREWNDPGSEWSVDSLFKFKRGLLGCCNLNFRLRKTNVFQRGVCNCFTSICRLCRVGRWWQEKEMQQSPVSAVFVWRNQDFVLRGAQSFQWKSFCWTANICRLHCSQCTAMMTLGLKHWVHGSIKSLSLSHISNMIAETWICEFLTFPSVNWGLKQKDFFILWCCFLLGSDSCFLFPCMLLSPKESKGYW